VHDRLEALLDEHLRGDAIFTNYNAGLQAAGAQNPDADARIFITDGGHGRGGAIAPFDPTTADGTKTYVISLRAQSPLKPGGTDDQRLQDIAARTGGAYFRNVTAEQLGPVLDTIDALALGCGTALPTAATAAASSKAAPTTTDLRDAEAPSLEQKTPGAPEAALPQIASVNDKRPYARFTTDLRSNPDTIDVTLNWEDPNVSFDVSSVKIVSFARRTTTIQASDIRRAVGGATVKRGGLKIRGSLGENYVSLHIAGVKRALGAARAIVATKAGAVAQTEVKENKKKKKKKSARKSDVRAQSSAAPGVTVSAFVATSAG